MVLLVHGFPSKIAALQFEWAWQNPHLSRQAPLASKLLLRKKIEGKSRYRKPRLSPIQQVEILREMLGFEGWRKWPLRVSILDEDIVRIWTNVGKQEGIRDVEWSIVGEDVAEDEVGDEGAKQERIRDLNLRKLMTLDLTDCTLLNYSINWQRNFFDNILRNLTLSYQPHIQHRHILATYAKSFFRKITWILPSVLTKHVPPFFTLHASLPVSNHPIQSCLLREYVRFVERKYHGET